VPAPIFTFFPRFVSPMYDKWFIFEFFPTLLFFTSTKLPTFDPSAKKVPGLILA